MSVSSRVSSLLPFSPFSPSPSPLAGRMRRTSRKRPRLPGRPGRGRRTRTCSSASTFEIGGSATSPRGSRRTGSCSPAGGSPLIDYQLPHDLLMHLGATYRLERGRVAYVGEADLVGSPALGPIVFMHRDSARDN